MATPNPPDLKEQYLATLRAAPQAPAAAEPIGLEELMGLQGRSAAAAASAPAFLLDEAQRVRTETRRSPQLLDLLALCAQGLSQPQAAEFAASIGASPKLCEHIAAQDREVGKVVKAAGDLHTIASAAAAQTGAQAEAQAEAALSAAHRVATDPARPRAERSAVELSFAEPFRLFQEEDGRAAKVARRVERRLQPLVEARDGARAETGELRLLQRFVESHRRGQ